MSLCSDKVTRVNLGLLKPLWHLYLKLTSKHSSSDIDVRPPLTLALTELFIAVEVAAEVTAIFVTQHRSVAMNVGCCHPNLFVCGFVCQHENFRTSKHRMMKLGRRCIVQKSVPSSNLGVIAPPPGVCTHKTSVQL